MEENFCCALPLYYKQQDFIMLKASFFIMIVLYILAGVNHFIHPGFYLKIMPPWLPYRKELVFISGITEVLFALLLIPSSTRTFAAWAIIALLIAVFPANIQMSINYYKENNPHLWLTLARLLLQPLLIIWAYQFTKPEKLARPVTSQA